MGVSKILALKFISQGIVNCIRTKPLVVSFEVTHSCTADCRHCDKGGKIDETLASPQQLRSLYDEIQPLVVQISGGEPLLRDDILDVVRVFKNPGSLPYIVFISNASLMTEEIYLALKKAGVDQFGISLDFPDERHDENRRIPGLYNHLDELLPRLATHGHSDIGMITAITRENLPYLEEIVRQVEKWNAYVNFSVYTALRTDDDSFLISSEEDLQLLRKTIPRLIELKKETGRIFTSEHVLRRYQEFLENGSIPNCQAGRRCFVINPDASLSPCAMKGDLRFPSQSDLIEQFTQQNTCGGCYVSMRANAEKSVWQALRDSYSLYSTMNRLKR